MRYDQVTTTLDLQMAAHMEHYHDLLREAELARLVKGAEREAAASAIKPDNLFQRLQRWISTPAAEPCPTTTGLKGV